MNSQQTPRAATLDADLQIPLASRVLTPGLLLGFVAIIIVLIGTLAISLANLRNLFDATQAVVHTQAVKTGLEQLLATALDAETGERGFVITGNARYLEPYNRARREIASHIADVRASTVDNREQQADLDRLSTAADLKLRELGDAVQKRRESGFAAAQAAVADNVGKRIMDDMRVIVARMEAREDALLSVRTTEARQSYRISRLTRMVTTGIALLVVTGLFVAVRRVGAERLRAAGIAERLRVTLGSIGDAVIVTDEEGRVVRLNAVAEALTGWTQADATGRRFEEVFVILNEETRRPAENPIGTVLRQGVSVGLANHTVLISKGGQEIPVDDSASPIKGPDGEVTGAVMVFRDVTERRRIDRDRIQMVEAERLARVLAEEAEARLHLALQAGGMGTWQWAIRTGDVSWGSALEAIHGLQPGAFPGTFEAFQAEIHPEDRAGVLQAIREALDQRRDHHIEYRIVRADGAVRWVEGRGQLFTDINGEPDRMVGVCSDITERKHAEERFRLAVEAAPTAMIMIDRRGRIQLVNAFTEQLLGYARGEIVGQSIEQLVPSRFRDGHPKHRSSFFTDPHQRPMGSGRDLYALRKDGSEVPVEIGLSPIQTAEGAFVLAAVTDITERKQSAALLQAALEAERAAKGEAQHANQLKDQFLATVSHELRAPLNAVLGWADMLRTGILDDVRRQRALTAVYVNAQRQTQLIDDLLDVTRIASGKLRVSRQAVDLRGVVQGALDVVHPPAEAKRIHVETEIDASVGTLFGDAARLQQIVWNVLTNAVKFTPEGGKIRMSVRRADSVVEIVVTDTGKGIAPDFLPFVFEPFRQADGSMTRSQGGLGLGLTIVKHLVEAHGGTVSAESAGEGQGSTFTVRLPIVAVYAEDREPSAPGTGSLTLAEEALGPVPSLEGITVLVVEDDADSRELVAACLEGSHASLLTAASATEALDLLQHEHVDVLLADIAMPGEDGYALIRKVRALKSPLAAAIPAAALTSFTHEDDKRRALQAGFQLHLAKPIGSRALVEAVATLAFIVSH